jgi:hypothetical protein
MYRQGDKTSEFSRFETSFGGELHRGRMRSLFALSLRLASWPLAAYRLGYCMRELTAAARPGSDDDRGEEPRRAGHEASFSDFVAEQGLKFYVCRAADPESKGKVENSVKLVKSNFFSGRAFADFDTLQAEFGQRLMWANRRISQATGMIPFADFCLDKEIE